MLIFSPVVSDREILRGFKKAGAFRYCLPCLSNILHPFPYNSLNAKIPIEIPISKNKVWEGTLLPILSVYLSAQLR